MGEQKTVPTDASVDDFLDAATPARRREDGLRLAGIFHEVTGADPVLWGPSIVGYGSYRATSGDWPIIGFSPRKAQLVLYVMQGFDGVDDLLAQLGKHKTNGGCLYMNKLDDVDPAVLRELAARSVAWMRGKYPPAGGA